MNNVKKLVKEREMLHLYVQRLETENAALAAVSNDDDTVKLLTHSSQSPTTLEVIDISHHTRVLSRFSRKRGV